MATTSEDHQDTKKRKHDVEIINEKDSDTCVFRDFQICRILREDARNKMVILHGNFEGDPSKDAVVILEKLPFVREKLQNTLRSKESKTETTLSNDIYSTHQVFSARIVPDSKATMIYPATNKHIDKYSEHPAFIVRETPELYATVTLPCLQASKFSTQWVSNILEKKSEADRIVFEDPDPETGFILLPDMKWNRTDLDSLYLVAIIHKHGIHSIRNLTAQQLPLLQNILDKGKAAIFDQFQVPASKLRIYFHYQPSYAHLHVHFTHVKFDAPGSDCLRAHLVEDVISNLQIDGDFYKKKLLMFVVREHEDLYKSYKAAGHFE
ncbi:m7GpppX diphosphatase-like [Pomacea canaliculata]|uniref:m7GpppX diphosphatase-like n=1 Tax=Pomacea canaliculata TaxID=400727 RepID=UPI000D736B26|nr:m7GpppX diphosphatase-like [Pomacea canaliculata]